MPVRRGRDHSGGVHDMSTAGPTLDTRRYDAVIFDMDGVVTDSASVHFAAWTELFDAFLATRPASAGEDTAPFTTADYERYVDGKPRYDGVADFLTARRILLPFGEPADPDDAMTICGLGNRKDRLFLSRLHRDGVPAFASTIALIRRLRRAGVGTAVFSASRNCAEVLTAAGIADLFRIRVDGLVAQELALPGKPDPAMLVETARRLGADPVRTAVVEDSEAGVAAGRGGGFGLVIGVDRSGHADRLRGSGADVVVTDLAGVRVRDGFRKMWDLPDAVAAWPQIADLLDADSAAVLLDFDGTLAEIVADPDAATLVDGAGRSLAALARVCPVAIVSGRGLDDVRKRVGVDGLWYAGSHGYELCAPDGTVHIHEAGAVAEPVLARAAADIEQRLRNVAGVRVEHKRFAVAVHHRNVARTAVGQVVGAAHEIGRRLGLRVTNGRMVTELQPDVDWDKGLALQWIMDRLGMPARPVYAGDDLTDEDAFDAIASDGIPIVVRQAENGDRRTAAHFALDGPARVRDFLDRLAELLSGADEAAASDSWLLTYDGYDPATEKLREALCTVGNGYLATRGAAPESRAAARHYPGTYAAGIYNELRDEIAGRTVHNESLVNLPNWLPVRWRIDDSEWFDVDDTDILTYRQQFDLRRAVLIRTLRVRDRAGRVTAVTQRRFAAMHAPHLCALEMTVAAENWSGRLTITSGIDGTVRNTLVDRYRDLSGAHLAVRQAAPVGTGIALVFAETTQSRIPIATATRTVVYRDDETLVVAREFTSADNQPAHEFEIEIVAGERVLVEKVAAVHTGHDTAISDPAAQALRSLADAGRFAELLSRHTTAWEHLWARLRIDADGSAHLARTTRLHLVHLAQTLSPHTADLDAGVPARGLHGEAYRGHVFWDELFVLPVLTVRFPALTRALLHYRYRRLPEARRAAADLGRRGALFPWQSGSDGREQSQRLHLNPRSGHWTPDPSHRAHHAGAAIAYSVWQYYQATEDREFLADHGAELLVEIARFWSGSAVYEPADDRYHLRGVIGPDEFHSGYPQAPYDGIDDNAYTNIMAAWTIRHALAAMDLLAPRARAELMETLGVTAAEPAHWAEVASRMFIPFHDGMISQFAGYHDLAELDWDAYRRRYGDIRRLDRILEAEGDDVNRYRVAKQADVLMLLYLLSADELRDQLHHMGYQLDTDTIPRMVDYYLARTTHGSTLSAVVHSWVLARANRDRALEFLTDVLESDIADIQGGTTAEGIHLAAMAGSVDLLQRCFTGLETRSGRMGFSPCWPAALAPLTFPIRYRGHRLTIRIDSRTVEVHADRGDAAPIEIECRGRSARLAAGETIRLPAGK